MKGKWIPVIGGATVLAGMVGLYATITDEFFTFFGEPASLFLGCTLVLNGGIAIAVGASAEPRRAGWAHVAVLALGGLAAAFLPNSMLLLFKQRGLIGGLWVLASAVSASALAWSHIAGSLGLAADPISDMETQLTRLDGLRDAEMLTPAECETRRNSLLRGVDLSRFESPDDLLLALAPLKQSGLLNDSDVSALRDRHELGSPPQELRWWFWVGWAIPTLLSIYGLVRLG